MSALARIALTPCGRSMLTRMNVPLAARAMQTSAGSYQTFCFFFLKELAISNDLIHTVAFPDYIFTIDE